LAPEKLARGEPDGADHNAPNSERTSAVHLGEQVDESSWDQMVKAPSASGPEPRSRHLFPLLRSGLKLSFLIKLIDRDGSSDPETSHN